MKKRWFSLLLSLLMVCSVMPLSAFAAESKDIVELTISEQSGKTQVQVGDTLTYTVSMGEVEKLAAFEFTLLLPGQLKVISSTAETMNAVAQNWNEEDLHIAAYGMDYTSADATKLLTVTCQAVSTGTVNFDIDKECFVTYVGNTQKLLEVKLNNPSLSISAGNTVPDKEEADEDVSPDENDSVDIPISGDKTSVKVEADVSGTTVKLEVPTASQLNKIVSDPSKNGSVVLNLSKVDSSVEKVDLPLKLIEKVAEEAKKSDSNLNSLEVKLPSGSIVLDAKTLQAITDEAEGSYVRLVLDKTGNKQLNNVQKSVLSGLEVYSGYEAYLYCTKTNKRIADFNGGVVTLSVPFTVPVGKSAENFSVWYISDSGKMERLSTWYANKRLYWSVGHFSDFVIVYDENIAPKANPETGADF